ncbi:MAG: TetR/AcrR family transcriptional regulator [Ruminococcus sp.]|nr:TetR/AcrR family transcriptional regulator [Ruminococcus sp.]
MSENNENREKLLECAKKEFLEKGFMKASLRKIAADAGLTTGAVYFFFKDKSGLFGAVIDEPLKQLMDTLEHHLNEENGEDFSAYEPRDGDHDKMAEQMIEVLYSHYDEMMILLNKAQGSEYEGYPDRLIGLLDSYYYVFAQKYADSVPGKRVNGYMVHWFSHVQINAFVHLLTHERDKDKALKNIKPVLDSIVRGWLGYVLEDDS